MTVTSARSVSSVVTGTQAARSSVIIPTRRTVEYHAAFDDVSVAVAVEEGEVSTQAAVHDSPMAVSELEEGTADHDLPAPRQLLMMF